MARTMKAIRDEMNALATKSGAMAQQASTTFGQKRQDRLDAVASIDAQLVRLHEELLLAECAADVMTPSVEARQLKHYLACNAGKLSRPAAKAISARAKELSVPEWVCVDDSTGQYHYGSKSDSLARARRLMAIGREVRAYAFTV